MSAACRGCHGRLQLPAGSSGFCNPCYVVVRLERLVFTRASPYAAQELYLYLRSICDKVEAGCEKYESDKTAGLCDSLGAPIPSVKEVQQETSPGPDSFTAGEHPGKADGEASTSKKQVKVEKESEEDKGPLAEAEPSRKKKDRSRRRRRTRSRPRRSHSRRRSKAAKETTRGKRSPEKEEERAEEEPLAEEVEAEDEASALDVEEASAEEVHDDAESDRRYSLTRTGRGTSRPTSREPLPRRPRTPSHSPPGYLEEDDRRPPRWKGYKHVLRGQYYSNHGASRSKGGKKGWRRK